MLDQVSQEHTAPAVAARLYAEVAVNSTFPHRQTFSYIVPEDVDVAVGSAVYVPFGKLTLQGVVVEVHSTPVFAEPEKIRAIRSLIGERPLLDVDRVALAQWVAREYVAPVFDAVALMLPPGFERAPVTTLHPLVDAAELDGLTLPSRQREVLDALLAAGTDSSLEALRARLRFERPEAVLAQLERAGLLSRQYSLARPRIAAKTVEMVSPALSIDDALGRIADLEPPKASRRGAVLERLIAKQRMPVDEAARLAGSRANLERLVRAAVVRYDRNGDNIALAMSVDEAQSELRTLTRTRRATLAEAIVRALDRDGERAIGELRSAYGPHAAAATRWLASNCAVHIEARAVERDPLADMRVERRPATPLLSAQAAAATAITRALDQQRGGTFLLHGVTGSGKTEVYLRALERCVELGRRAIVMVPEIALTPQTVRRFRERFGRVAVLHSGLSDGERFDQWHGIADGRYDVVIGSRSAVFAPQPDLGLIVLDEEHEWTYKQNDPQPRYHARDVAIELARLKRAVVVLGSATPDIVTYERAERGVYTMLGLPERIRPVVVEGSLRYESSLAMPRVDVVDLRAELRDGNRGMFSRELTTAIGAALRADEQVILFLNRRGLAGHVQCRDCGHVPQCSSCSVALTFHKQYDRLVCHQCNRQSKLAATCRECGSPRVRLLGVGIEQVETEAKRAFPHARLLRWDRDATRTKGAHDRILGAFLAREADILIGTQMLAKGLDMPGVTLVGIVNADVALHLPDFRSPERTFQLLTQVAGRAGRGERPGRVIIQSYTPDHPAIAAAARYDYDGFAATELAARRTLGYPPYGRLTRLILAHSNPRQAREEAGHLARALVQRRAVLGSDTMVVGPSEAYVPRVRGRWRWQIVLRGSDPSALIRDFVLPANWSLDVDPASLL